MQKVVNPIDKYEYYSFPTRKQKERKKTKTGTPVSLKNCHMSYVRRKLLASLYSALVIYLLSTKIF